MAVKTKQRGHINEIYCHWRDTFGTINGIKPGDNHIIIEQEVIPIIVVPGIMGTRLRQRELDSKGNVVKVWDPDDRWYNIATHISKKPNNAKLKKLKELLIGEGVHDAEFLTVLDDEDGSLYSSYDALINTLDAFPSENDSVGCKHCFEYPVYEFGYNWTASSAESGKQLKNHIEQVIAQYQQAGRDCRHVILVTHSMGGLVAREACRLLKLDGAEDKVLCVIHGAQPAHGAVVAYSRMKLGTDYSLTTAPDITPQKKQRTFSKANVKAMLAAWAMGSTGKAVTVKMARMPGALELLPTKHYRDNQGNPQWLHYTDPHSGQRQSLPQSDPYTEIYAQHGVDYALIEPRWLEPWNQQKSRKNNKRSVIENRDKKSAWQEYLKNLKKAKKFHDTLGNYTHPRTYQFHGEGLATVDYVSYAYDTIDSWYTPPDEDDNFINYTQVSPRSYVRCQLHPRDGTGDGTVSRQSALGIVSGVNEAVSFTPRELNTWSDMEHQAIYEPEPIRHYVLEKIEGVCHARIRQECHLPPEDKKPAEAFEESTADDNADIWL